MPSTTLTQPALPEFMWSFIYFTARENADTDTGETVGGVKRT